MLNKQPVFVVLEAVEREKKEFVMKSKIITIVAYLLIAIGILTLAQFVSALFVVIFLGFRNEWLFFLLVATILGILGILSLIIGSRLRKSKSPAKVEEQFINFPSLPKVPEAVEKREVNKEKKMFLKRLLEKIIMTIFIICCVVSPAYFGGKYFAGFQYATPSDRMLMRIVDLVITLCLLYFVCRFFFWLYLRVKKLITNIK